ncbi:MAG: hypothetical protein ACTTHG_04660 [Treponemataceae bacterium]
MKKNWWRGKNTWCAGDVIDIKIKASGENDCDIWVEKILSKVFPKFSLAEKWGPAVTNNCDQHKNNLAKLGLLQDTPSLGDNIVIQENKDGRGVHAMIVSINIDGSVDLAQCTKNAALGGNPKTDYLFAFYKRKYGEKSGVSQVMHYESFEKFDEGWGKLYYIPLNNASLIDKIKNFFNNKK